MIVVMTKAELRREMRERLRSIGAEREEKSRAIAGAIMAHPAFARSRRIALFSPLLSEPDVELLWKVEARGFCYPRIGGEEIEFAEVQIQDHLSPAVWHARIREPLHARARIISPAEIDLILVPGLAFTRAGQRLGRGGGFYDRFLARLSASTTKLGICFEQQIVETLPAEPHDQNVDAVITEGAVA
jgi:5-formyltetrahydrofolate cyclo-ligase